MIRFIVVLFQDTVKFEIDTTGRSRVFEIILDGMINIRGENGLLKKGLHHSLKIILPFLSVRLCFTFIFIPGQQMREFMNCSDKEGIGIEVIIYRNPVSGIFKRMAIITMFGTTISGDLKLTFKIIYPARDNRSSARRQIIIQNSNLIQFYFRIWYTNRLAR